MKRAIRELTQRLWFDEQQRFIPVAFFDFEALDDPRIDDQRERELVLLETRRRLIRAMRKMGCGRRGLPKACVQLMYEDYKRVGSLSRVAKLYRRTRQCMWDIFRSHGLPMNQRNFGARIRFDGKIWTPCKGGYFRESRCRRGAKLLHHAIWEKRTGRKIPRGYQVAFANADNTDFTSRNLVCLPIAQVSLLHYRRRYPKRAHLTRDERRKFWNRNSLRLYYEKRDLNYARGMRCDGKPRRRPILKRLEAA